MLRHILILLLAFVMLGRGGLARAENLVTALAALEDVRGNLTLADVQQREFVPVDQTLSRGYTNSIYWLRIRFRRPVGGEPLVVRLRPFLLDQAILYQLPADIQESWRADVQGFDQPADAETPLPVSHGFRLLPALGSPVVYLRVRTKGAMLVSPQVLTESEAIRFEHHLDLLLLATLAYSLLSTLWCISSPWLLGNPLRLPLIGFQLVFCVWAGCMFGNFHSWLPPLLSDWYAPLVRISFCLLPAASVRFSAALFRHFQAPPALIRRYRLFYAWFPLQILGLATGHTALVLMLNVPVHMVSRWYAVFVALQFAAPSSTARRMAQVVHLVMAALSTAVAVSLLGRSNLYRQSETDLLFLFSYGILAQLLSQLVLVAQAHAAGAEARRAQLRVPQLEALLAEARDQYRQAQQQAQRDDLTGVVSRRQWLAQVRQILQQERPAAGTRHLLLLDVDHFASINDTYGSVASDQLLQQLAAILQDNVRDPDLLGRVGGEVFAVAVSDISVAQACQLGERLRAQVAAAALHLPGGLHLRLTVSVGIAPLRAEMPDLDAWMREANQALAQAKRQGRDRVMLAAELR